MCAYVGAHEWFHDKAVAERIAAEPLVAATRCSRSWCRFHQRSLDRITHLGQRCDGGPISAECKHEIEKSSLVSFVFSISYVLVGTFRFDYRDKDGEKMVQVCCILLWALAIPTWPLGLAVTAGPAEAMLAGVLGSR